MLDKCNHRWRLAQDNEYDDSMWWVVCEVCGEYGEHHQVNERIANIEARYNELLVACEEVVEYCGKEAYLWDDEGWMFDELINDARAIIKKARGK